MYKGFFAAGLTAVADVGIFTMAPIYANGRARSRSGIT
ncbi:hypothetical protein CVCC1112_3853 [Paenarthrobacter nicotinovorans]|nr:hypothetical protein CVCC1112_3853 [Paenarthrobacter nicotinovorans]